MKIIRAVCPSCNQEIVLNHRSVVYKEAIYHSACINKLIFKAGSAIDDELKALEESQILKSKFGSNRHKNFNVRSE